MNAEPGACLQCLRRGQLLGALAPYIEGATSSSDGPEIGDLLSLCNQDLAAAVAPNDHERILMGLALRPNERFRQELAASGCWACCYHDDLFPQSLRQAADAPWVIYGRGERRLLGTLADGAEAVAVVGARRATSYGREVARTLGRALAENGVTVISGMAFGIDACAHRGALEAGKTVAVLGCGSDVAYPATHRSLWRRIQENGLVLSELPPGTGAWRWAFPARNRIVAALAGVTVVVEAAESSSSLRTAEVALDLGREVGAIPGPVNSRLSGGPNILLSVGALVVRGAQDVLDALHLADSGTGDRGPHRPAQRPDPQNRPRGSR